MTRITGQQAWQAEDYDANARFVSDLGGAVLEWLAPQSAERILDLGCGDGALSVKLVEAGADVVGVDTADSFLEAARSRGLDARYMNGEALQFEHEFDAVFSNAALHWMTDPEAVIAGVRRALRAEGRFVAEFGGHGNVAAIITAMRAVAQRRSGDPALTAPWFFPTAGEYASMLEAKGFAVRRIELIPRQTPLKTGIEAWLKTFRSSFFAQFAGDSDAALGEVVDLLRPSLCDTEGHWSADYVRLRVEAHLA